MINNPEILMRYIQAAQKELEHMGVNCHLSAAGGDSIQLDVSRHLEIHCSGLVTASLNFTISIDLENVKVQDYVSIIVKAIRQADGQIWSEIQCVEGLS